MVYNAIKIGTYLLKWTTILITVGFPVTISTIWSILFLETANNNLKVITRINLKWFSNFWLSSLLSNHALKVNWYPAGDNHDPIIYFFFLLVTLCWGPIICCVLLNWWYKYHYISLQNKTGITKQVYNGPPSS